MNSGLPALTGEYISPENIESVLITVPTIEQIWVTGQSDKNAAVAIAVPSVESKEVCNGSQREREAFCQDVEACARICAQLADAGAAAKLKVNSHGDFHSQFASLLSAPTGTKAKKIWPLYNLICLVWAVVQTMQLLPVSLMKF